MDQADVDSQIFSDPPALIDPKFLNLKLSKSRDITPQLLLDQIQKKIDILNRTKNENDKLYNQKIEDFRRSSKGDSLNLSKNVGPAIDNSNKIIDDMNKIYDNYKIIEENSLIVSRFSQAYVKREKLRELKDFALKLKEFYALFDDLKRNYEKSDYIKVSIRYHQIKERENEFSQFIKIVETYLSNFNKKIYEELNEYCDSGFTRISLFQLLYFTKNPDEVIKIIKKCEPFDKISNIEDKKFETLIDKYHYRFDVLCTIIDFAENANVIMNTNENWELPLKIVLKLNDEKFFESVKKGVSLFIQNMPENYPIFNSLKENWDKLESILYMSKCQSSVAARAVHNLLIKGYNQSDSSPLLDYLGKLLEIYNDLFKKNNNDPNSFPCKFIKETFESFIIILINSLINNPFNAQEKRGNLNLNDSVEIFKQKAAAIHSTAFEVKRNLDFARIFKNLRKVFEDMIIGKKHPIYPSVREFYERVLAPFFPNMLYFCIPAFIGDAYRNDAEMLALNIRHNFYQWELLSFSKATLTDIARDYLEFSVGGILRTKRVNNLMDKYIKSNK